MTLRCRVGDACWIVGGRPAENIGRVVEVLRRLDTPEGHHWEIVATSPLYAWNLGVIKLCPPGRHLGIADRFLRPIRSEDADDIEFREMETSGVGS